VDSYPLIEFFGAEQIVDKLVNDGLLKEILRPQQLNLYRLTSVGERLAEILPTIGPA
jgi:hypothetical protein